MEQDREKAAVTWKRLIRNGIIKLIRAICLVVVIVCLIRIGQAYFFATRYEPGQDEWEAVPESPEEEEQEQIQEEYAVLQTDCETQSGNELPRDGNDESQTKREKLPTSGSGIPGEEGGQLVLKKYKTLYRENADLAGWLTVAGTKIDYPVMQCEDDEYYLHHDFDGEYSKYGCLYVREQADLEEGTNFVIYGHNMRDGSMFGELDLYLDEEFYRRHSTVLFSTLFEERRYVILAVFRSQVYSEDSDAFKYYQFYDAQTEDEFNGFYQNIKELSLYDTGVEAEFGDTFLTLSTCAYHVNDGRFVVVAKRVE